MQHERSRSRSPTAFSVSQRKHQHSSCSHKKLQRRTTAAVSRDNERLFTETKAALFDLVSDVRSKLDSDDTIKRNYDNFVKEMVLLGSIK